MTARRNTPAAKKRRARLYTILGMLAFLALGAFLALKAFEESVVFFVTPSDLEEREVTGEENFRLGGLVEPGSIVHGKDGLRVMFRVTDGGASLPVEYEGILPDLFREGQGVIAEGRVGPGGAFQADRILAKHDENYMPPEVEKALKERGYWQHGGETTDETS